MLKFDRENFILDYISVDWENLIESGNEMWVNLSLKFLTKFNLNLNFVTKFNLILEMLALIKNLSKQKLKNNPWFRKVDFN